MRRILPPLLTAATLLLVAVPAASARTMNYWIAAKPVTWNMIPNERDAIMGTTYAPSQTVFPTVVYKRYTRGWKRELRNISAGTSNQDDIPGPLIRARVGDKVLVHFKNMDTAFNRVHSMHFHG